MQQPLSRSAYAVERALITVSHDDGGYYFVVFNPRRSCDVTFGQEITHYGFLTREELCDVVCAELDRLIPGARGDD